MLRDEEIEVRIGRCQAPSGQIHDVMQVVHRPTGINRQRTPLGVGKNRREIERTLRNEIEDELRTKGLTQYIVS
jgi:hypothetical protein